MKIVVLGCTGMLGHQIVRGLSTEHSVVGTIRGSVDRLPNSLIRDGYSVIPGIDAHDINGLKSLFTLERPEIVINCIGQIKQKAALDSEMVFLNSYFPHSLKELCREVGARLIHFSTDCVFSGERGNYSEGDISDAQDIYGKSKYLGELHDDHCITIRSSIIGPELSGNHGLFQWFVDSTEEDIKGYTKAIYTGFSTIEMIRIIKLVLKNPEIHGLWQVASAPISKFSLLSMINSEMGLNKNIIPYDGFRCDRSLNGERFSSRTGYVPPAWEVAIKEMVDDYRNQKVLQ